MKIAIVFYSYSGNTRKVAQMFAEELKGANQVECLDIKALDESDNFFKQCIRARKKTRAQITDIKTDLSGYDTIFFGTPVWAFGPTPALWTYFDRCKGVEGKKAVVFVTCGSGAGTGRCVDKMEQIVKEKGAAKISRIIIPQAKIKDASYVSTQLKNNI